jgi:hypothetical protein
MPANPRKTRGAKACASRGFPRIPGQSGSAMTGLSRRRSRVRVPSLPLETFLHIAFSVACLGEICTLERGRLLPRLQNRSQGCRGRLSKRPDHSWRRAGARHLKCASCDRPTAARRGVARVRQAAPSLRARRRSASPWTERIGYAGLGRNRGVRPPSPCGSSPSSTKNSIAAARSSPRHRRDPSVRSSYVRW